MAGEIFTKKSEYETKKQVKLRQSKRRLLLKSLKKTAVWTTVVLTIAFTGAGIFVSLRGGNQSNTSSLEDFIQRYQIQGREHIALGATHPEYNSNPPTSGWHYAEEAEWGIYDKELPDEQLVHNLEHCGIWISYQSSVASSTKEKLTAFTKQFPTKLILTPRAKNDSPIALASWGALMKLPDFNNDLMSAFIAAFLNKNGPECQAM